MGIYNEKDILSLIRKIIYKDTIYLRHWRGKVLDDQDSLNKGRVKVSIPELGWEPGMHLGSDGIWCWPRQGYSIIPPAVGEWVEVYFLGGNPKDAVYLTGMGEMKGNTPRQYSDPKKRVLWQDSVTGDYIQYDQDSKELDISVSTDVKLVKYGKLTIGGGSEAFAKGTTLASFLSTLFTWATTHTHMVASVGSPTATALPALSSPPDVKSTTILGE